MFEFAGADSAILAAARAEAHGTPALRGATELDEPGSAPESWDARHPLAAALAGSTPGPSLVAALAELTPRELSDPALSERSLPGSG